jgi:hypothetical protein
MVLPSVLGLMVDDVSQGQDCVCKSSHGETGSRRLGKGHVLFFYKNLFSWDFLKSKTPLPQRKA